MLNDGKREKARKKSLVWRFQQFKNVYDCRPPRLEKFDKYYLMFPETKVNYFSLLILLKHFSLLI